MNNETNQPQLTVAQKADLFDELLGRMRQDKVVLLWDCQRSLSPERLVAELQVAVSSQRAADAMNAVTNYLWKTCEFVEAGFYFESGGCFGMALALHELFTKAGLAPQFAFSMAAGHAVVELDGKYYDYRGETSAMPGMRIVSKEQLLSTAYAFSHSAQAEQDLHRDKGYAETAINAALELVAEGAPVPGEAVV